MSPRESQGTPNRAWFVTAWISPGRARETGPDVRCRLSVRQARPRGCQPGERERRGDLGARQVRKPIVDVGDLEPRGQRPERLERPRRDPAREHPQMPHQRLGDDALGGCQGQPRPAAPAIDGGGQLCERVLERRRARQPACRVRAEAALQERPGPHASGHPTGGQRPKCRTHVSTSSSGPAMRSSVWVRSSAARCCAASWAAWTAARAASVRADAARARSASARSRASSRITAASRMPARRRRSASATASRSMRCASAATASSSVSNAPSSASMSSPADGTPSASAGCPGGASRRRNRRRMSARPGTVHRSSLPNPASPSGGTSRPPYGYSRSERPGE
jgi:hypothetical protein